MDENQRKRQRGPGISASPEKTNVAHQIIFYAVTTVVSYVALSFGLRRLDPNRQATKEVREEHVRRHEIKDRGKKSNRAMKIHRTNEWDAGRIEGTDRERRTRRDDEKRPS